MPHRLVTLGRLALLDCGGNVEPSLSTRRRKLALLAYLALQRTPVPRCVVADMFWPEVDEHRARRSLSDALSHLRRVLGRDLVDLHSPELAVHRGALPVVDALELVAAAAAGDHAAVVSLYSGPFLSGVFVDGSSAFEDWSTRERRRVEDLFATACGAECRRMAETGSWEECASLAERWLEVRPLEPAAALALLGALRAHGSREALARARDAWLRLRHQLARDYEVQPDASIGALAAEIEAELHAAPVVPSGRVRTAAEPGPGGAGPPRPRSPWRRVAAAVAVLVVALGLTAHPRSAPTPAAAASPVVLMAPASLEVTDTALTWLAEGLPLMVLEGVRQAGGVELVRMPTRGVTLHAFGTLGQRDSTLLLDLTLRGADGRLHARHRLQAAGPLQLAELVVVRLLNAASVTHAVPALGEVETSSVAAWQHLARAVRELAIGNTAAGHGALDAAIAADSGFGSAVFLRYQEAADRGDVAVVGRLAPLVRRLRDEGSEWDRLHVDMFDARLRGDAARSLALGRALVERYPHTFQSYIAATSVLTAYGRWDEAIDLFTRALALWSAPPEGEESRRFYCGVLAERGWIYHGTYRLDEAIADFQLGQQVCPEVLAMPGRLSWSLLAAGRFAEFRQADHRAHALHPGLSRLLEGRMLLRQRRWAAVDTVVRDMGLGAARGEALDLRIQALRERGRFEEANDTIATLPEKGIALRLTYFDGLARTGRAAALREDAAGLLVAGPLPTVTIQGDTLGLIGYVVRGWAWHRAVYGDALIRLGDTTGIGVLIDSLTVIGPRSHYGRDWRLHHHLRGLLAARAGDHARAATEFEAGLWLPSGWTRTNLELARSYRRLGRYPEALAILRSAYAGNLDGMARYVTFTELDYEMALTFSALRMQDSAAVYAGAVRDAWRDADPPVRALLDSLPPLRVKRRR